MRAKGQEIHDAILNAGLKELEAAALNHRLGFEVSLLDLQITYQKRVQRLVHSFYQDGPQKGVAKHGKRFDQLGVGMFVCFVGGLTCLLLFGAAGIYSAGDEGGTGDGAPISPTEAVFQSVPPAPTPSPTVGADSVPPALLP